MKIISKALLPSAILIAVPACDLAPKARTPQRATEQSTTEQDVDTFEADVRIAAANKRIDELERRVGALEATPEKLDLDLINQRVTALEVKVPQSVEPSPSALRSDDRPDDTQSADVTGRPSETTRRLPRRSSKPNPSAIVQTPRLATPTEAKAFAPPRKPD